MTAIQTLPKQTLPKQTSPNTIAAPQAEYLIDDFEPPGLAEDEGLDPGIAWFREWCRECNENRRKAGLPYEDPMTMEEIVAIVKEARAERYAEEQEQKKAACR